MSLQPGFQNYEFCLQAQSIWLTPRPGLDYESCDSESNRAKWSFVKSWLGVFGLMNREIWGSCTFSNLTGDTQAKPRRISFIIDLENVEFLMMHCRFTIKTRMRLDPVLVSLHAVNIESGLGAKSQRPAYVFCRGILQWSIIKIPPAGSTQDSQYNVDLSPSGNILIRNIFRIVMYLYTYPKLRSTDVNLEMKHIRTILNGFQKSVTAVDNLVRLSMQLWVIILRFLIKYMR